MRSVGIMNQYLVASLTKDWLPTQISDAIRDGAEGFFRTQYGSISRMAGVLALVILGIYMFRKSTPEQDAAGLER
jgi:Na+/H+-translocating membrane pyrophosphatase